MEGRVNVYRVATHTNSCLSVCVCLCAFGTMDQITYFYFQICIRVLFYSSDILRACFFFFLFCESSVGFVGDLG